MEGETSPFLQFVDTLNEEVMAISAVGWYDYDRVFHETSYNLPNLTDPLKLYSYLQFNVLYDNAHRLTELFDMGRK